MADKRKLADLIPDHANANKGTERGRYALEASLRQYGAGRSILLDKNGRIIAGNKTAEVAADIGLEDVVIVQTDGKQIVAVQRTDLDIDSAEGRGLAYADNRVGELSLDWDAEQVLADINAGVDLSALFRQEELDELIADLQPKGTEGDTEPQIDRAEELRQKWGVQPGDLWQLGEHRLICGDCTDAAVVERVMGGERAQLCFTDPPYGANIAYATIDDSQEALVSLIGGFFVLAENHSDVIALTPGVANMWHYRRPDWVLCWYYGAGTGRTPWGFTSWQPVMVFGADPKLASGEGCHPDAFQFMQTKDDMEERKQLSHIVPKPLSVWRRFLERLSNKHTKIVYEPFSGSGTTIIACEQMRLRCRAVEIAPGYVAVALERWATHTGKTPVKLG